MIPLTDAEKAQNNRQKYAFYVKKNFAMIKLTKKSTSYSAK